MRQPSIRAGTRAVVGESCSPQRIGCRNPTIHHRCLGLLRMSAGWHRPGFPSRQNCSRANPAVGSPQQAGLHNTPTRPVVGARPTEGQGDPERPTTVKRPRNRHPSLSASFPEVFAFLILNCHCSATATHCLHSKPAPQIGSSSCSHGLANGRYARQHRPTDLPPQSSPPPSLGAHRPPTQTFPRRPSASGHRATPTAFEPSPNRA